MKKDIFLRLESNIGLTKGAYLYCVGYSCRQFHSHASIAFEIFRLTPSIRIQVCRLCRNLQGLNRLKADSREILRRALHSGKHSQSYRIG